MPKSHVIAVSDRPHWEDRLEFNIDFATGEITDLVTRNVNAAMWTRIFEGWRNEAEPVAAFDWQQSYPAPDPFHNPKSFAWKLLAYGWTLTGDLAQYPAPLPDELPEGVLA